MRVRTHIDRCKSGTSLACFTFASCSALCLGQDETQDVHRSMQVSHLVVTPVASPVAVVATGQLHHDSYSCKDLGALHHKSPLQP